MKILLLLGAGLGLSAAAWFAPTADVALAGQYLEVRSATVFGGACHVNSELQSGGRQALLAWHIESGAAGGVDLAGTTVVAALSGDDNLGDATARRSVLYVDSGADPAQRRAATEWLRAHCADVLGDVRAVETLKIEFERAGDAFRCWSPVFEFAGLALADRSCCTMPDARWYEPLDATIQGSVVGNSTTCRYVGAHELPAWIHEDANNAHVARFEQGATGGASAVCISE